MHDPHFLRLTEWVDEVFSWGDSRYSRTDEVLLPIQISNIFFGFFCLSDIASYEVVL